ncbi:MAG: hypothetical protein OEY11_04700 [Gammaproteobacteria bacterium]|nr:hypothetical protein [Gammaproteobacteria bacterium]
MNTRIIINGKEITSPFVKALLITGAIIIAALVLAIVIFVLLPVIGVAVTLTAGFVVIFVLATIVSVATMAFITVLISWLFGAAEFRVERFHKRK